MQLIILLLIILLLFGGGGGYCAYDRYGYTGGISIFVFVLIVVMLLYFFRIFGRL